MASPNSHITVELRAGPMLGAVTDVLSSAEEFAELIPDWHADERERFLEKCRAMQQLLLLNLRFEG